VELSGSVTLAHFSVLRKLRSWSSKTMMPVDKPW